MNRTTISVTDSTVTKLLKLKIHPRQSNEEVVLDLISYYNKHAKNNTTKPNEVMIQ